MGPTPSTSGGGIVGALVSCALVLFVLVIGTAVYYGLHAPALPLDILRRDPERISASTPEPTMRWVKAAVVRRWAELAARLDGRDAHVAVREQLDKLKVVASLVTLRAVILMLALPLLLPAMAWALLEGLWTRERIALTTGFSSAAAFGLGKGLCLSATLLACAYIVTPWDVGIGVVLAWLLLFAPAGSYLLGRNLPLHF